jgi:hypothetical protein
MKRADTQPMRALDTTCAACGSHDDVHEEARLPGVVFCPQCWALAVPATDDDELGAGD